MLALDGIGKRFGRTWALRDVSLDLSAGQWVGLVGPNGSGKTTLLDVTSGLARPTEGRVLIDGRPVAEDRVGLKERVAYVGHRPGLYDDLTVRENLVFTGRVHGLDKAEAGRRAETLADRMGLASRLLDRVQDLSRGLAQRAALARALVPDPDVVLLDEPFTGLDVDARDRLAGLLLDHDDGRRVIVVTAHDVDDVPGARRVVVLDGGRVAFDGDRDRADRAAAKLYGVAP